jgi:phage shock protein A
MQLFQRFVHLARADAHGVIDSLEDRGLLLRQCLREAELEVARKRGRRDELDAALETIARQHAQAVARGLQLDEDVQLALGRGEEDLARFAIRRLLALRRQRERLEEKLRVHREAREKLVAKLEEQERELEALRDRVRQALAEAQASEREAQDPEASAGAVRDEEIELELLRRRATEREVQP